MALVAHGVGWKKRLKHGFESRSASFRTVRNRGDLNNPGHTLKDRMGARSGRGTSDDQGRLHSLDRAQPAFGGACGLPDGGASGELAPDPPLDLRPDPRPAQTLALSSSSPEPGVDPFDDDRPLELGEHSEHLEERFARWRRRVQALLVQVQIDPLRL